MKICETCGCERHSLLRYIKGWICYQLYMAIPNHIAMGKSWRFWNDLLLPSAGDCIYDQRGCRHD